MTTSSVTTGSITTCSIAVCRIIVAGGVAVGETTNCSSRSASSIAVIWSAAGARSASGARFMSHARAAGLTVGGTSSGATGGGEGLLVQQQCGGDIDAQLRQGPELPGTGALSRVCLLLFAGQILDVASDAGAVHPDAFGGN